MESIPDYSVAVGSPARIIKRYNPETQTWQKTDKDGNFLAKVI
jgi:acetyltransferase-like isoleucine patch superfamily enzyme